MEELLQFIITAPHQGKRLDAFLADVAPYISREIWKIAIKSGKVTVNNRTGKAALKLAIGDQVRALPPPPAAADALPAQPVPLDIIYEDNELAVISKPAGLVVHPGAGQYYNTLANALLYHFTSLSDCGGKGRPGIVHRLDKNTSGGLVIAKNNRAHQKLAQQFKEHAAVREYITLVRRAVTSSSGEIIAPIGRSPNNRQKMAVVPGGKEAITHFNVLRRWTDYTLLKVTLVTGRTHQIRVHLAYIKHPVVGDQVYSSGKNPWQLPFQLLHACKLGFSHPATGRYMEFDIPLPDYFKKIIDAENQKHLQD